MELRQPEVSRRTPTQPQSISVYVLPRVVEMVLDRLFTKKTISIHEQQYMCPACGAPEGICRCDNTEWNNMQTGGSK